jgi:hypothetical protein
MMKLMLKHVLKLVLKHVMKLMMKIVMKLPCIEKFYKCHDETCAETHVETRAHNEILQVSQYFFICNIVVVCI